MFTKENAATLGRKGGQKGKGHTFAHGRVDPANAANLSNKAQGKSYVQVQQEV